MEKEKKKKLKRQAAATAVAAVASASVVMGGVFDNPDELLNGEDDAPVPVTDSVLGPAAAAVGDGDAADAEDDAAEDPEERRRGGPRARVHQWIRSLPWGVRALAGVPLWACGWLILTAGSALWSGAVFPVLGTVLTWVVTAALLLGAFALTAKAAFPDLPWKKIVNKRSFLGLLIATAALALADSVVPLFWDGYGRVAQILRAVGTTGILAGVTGFFARRENARRRKLAAKAAAEMPPEEKETLEQAMERKRREILQMVDETNTR